MKKSLKKIQTGAKTKKIALAGQRQVKGGVVIDIVGGS